MKVYNTTYKSRENLQNFLDSCSLDDNYKGILVQVFSGIPDEKHLEKIIFELKVLLPKAKIIGSTTAGEVCNGLVSVEQVVISISCFEHTTVETILIEKQDSSEFELGVEAGRELISNNTKCIILFSTGILLNRAFFNGDNFIEGVQSVNPDIPIAGGIAGDNFSFSKTLVFTELGIVANGIAGVALNSEKLQVFREYNLGYQEIGKVMKITRASDRILYSLDSEPAADVFSKYLGSEALNRLPFSSLEFPFIIHRNGMKISRNVMAPGPDGSLIMVGNVNEGDEIQFAFGNFDMIINRTMDIARTILTHPIEALFIYSCVSRKSFLQDSIQKEMDVFNTISSVSGFFTYGEFFHCNSENIVLNTTSTLLTMSENPAALHTLPDSMLEIDEPMTNTTGRYENILRFISRLTNSFTSELSAANKNLEIQNEILHTTNKLLEESQNHLKNLNATKDKFFSIIAHDLRNPFTTFISLSELMLNAYDRLSDDEKRKQIELIFRTSVELHKLLENLLQWANSQTGRIKFQPENIDLHDVSKSSITLNENLARAKKINIINHISPKTYLKADLHMISTIMRNLISNAVKFTPELGAVIIKSHNFDNMLEVSIEDTGIGISPENYKKLFQIGQNFSGSVKSNESGTGLGLIICKEFVEKHGGAISFVSEPGKGSTFKFTIPN